MPLRDGEWRLDYEGTSLVFGPPDLPIFNTAAPDLGDADLRTDDDHNPRADGRAFGQDFRGGRTVTFPLGVYAPGEAAVRDVLGDLSRAWRADAVRTSPGAMAALYARRAGRERVIFGRPRRFAISEQDVDQGVALVTADFAAADDLWYSAEEHAATVSLVPPASGGLLAPLASPLATTATSDRSRGIVVGGNVETWPVLEITGPITGPVVEVVGAWRMEFALTLRYDEVLVVDTRPWRRTILRNGASAAGSLTRTSPRISRAKVQPGAHEIALRGVDATGTAALTFRWRDAHTHL